MESHIPDKKTDEEVSRIRKMLIDLGHSDPDEWIESQKEAGTFNSDIIFALKARHFLLVKLKKSQGITIDDDQA